MMPLYSRVQLFSGGGSRFGYYLGSYAALCELNLNPELVLAACGGSLAALLVDIAPNPIDLKQLIRSHELHQVITAIRPTYPTTDSLITDNRVSDQKPRYFYQAIKRLYLTNNLKKLDQWHSAETAQDLIDELNHLAMFSIGNGHTDDESLWLDNLISMKSHCSDQAPDIAIIASRLLAGSDNLTEAKLQKPKLQQVLFAPSLLAQHPNLVTAFQCPTHQYATHRIEADIHALYTWNIQQAIRASMADMYYLTPTHIEEVGWCLGGVIDLMPIEMACQLGATVFAETKPVYDKWLASPAIKRVFGFDPNQRLQAVHSFKSKKLVTNHSQPHIYWLPFADNSKVLAGQHTRKKIQLRKGLIDLIHADYDEFVSQMQKQWQYGYDKTMQHMQHNDHPSTV